jgi:pseudaminic acid synthase
VAVALGACIVEKHFTLSRSTPLLVLSLEPAEFKAMVEAVRTAEKAIRNVYYGVSEQESKSRIFRRSLFVVRDMNAGEKFTKENIRSIRPANGLLPKYLDEVLGRSAACAIASVTPLDWQLLA